MTKQQQRQIETIRKQVAAGNMSSAARQLSAMIRAHVRPVADRAEMMRVAIELNLHTHRDFCL